MIRLKFWYPCCLGRFCKMSLQGLLRLGLRKGSKEKKMVPRGLKIAVRGTEIDILSQFQEEKIRMVWLQKLKLEEPETHPLGLCDWLYLSCFLSFVCLFFVVVVFNHLRRSCLLLSIGMQQRLQILLSSNFLGMKCPWDFRPQRPIPTENSV